MASRRTRATRSCAASSCDTGAVSTEHEPTTQGDDGSDRVDLGGIYRDSRERITAMLIEGGDAGAGTPVPACPGWRVRDVVAHLVGVIEDVFAGRLTGPPPAEQTAEEVERHRAETVDELLAAWAAVAPAFEDLLTQMQSWPGMLDVLTHEQDIRAALGLPGARDDRGIVLGARALAGADGLPARLVATDDPASPLAAVDDDRPVAHASAFEIVRLRLGRRTPDEVRALAWTGDPEPILAQLFIFGPTAVSLGE
jgi:uncharacterized protein (TIGR03083 family)